MMEATDANEVEQTKNKLVELLPDNETVSSKKRDKAERLVRKLWTAREVTAIEIDGSDDGITVWVQKEDMFGQFSVSHNNSVHVAEEGKATFEIHDYRGYRFIEGITVSVSEEIHNEIVSAVEREQPGYSLWTAISRQ